MLITHIVNKKVSFSIICYKMFIFVHFYSLQNVWKSSHVPPLFKLSENYSKTGVFFKKQGWQSFGISTVAVPIHTPNKNLTYLINFYQFFHTINQSSYKIPHLSALNNPYYLSIFPHIKLLINSPIFLSSYQSNPYISLFKQKRELFL